MDFFILPKNEVTKAQLEAFFYYSIIESSGNVPSFCKLSIIYTLISVLGLPEYAIRGVCGIQ